MSEVKWSENQKSVIEARNSNILVSAAAGSGKTAVLVERIIRLITDKENPTSLDELIVMTFTRAAAEEIRQRVGKALSEIIKKEPDNEYLKIQKNILPRARIGTIDGVCQDLIRQNYQLLDIDPGFRVLDDGEKKMLQADILAEIMEKNFSEGEDSFYEMYNSLSGKAGDSRVSDLVLKIFGNIDSEPWPLEALSNLTRENDKETEYDFENTVWFRAFIKSVNETLLSHKKRLEEAEELINSGIGPDKYQPDVDDLFDKNDLIDLTSPNEDFTGRYSKILEYLAGLKLKTLSRAKREDYDTTAYDFVRSAIDNYKNYLKKLKNEVFILDENEMKGVLCETAKISSMLCRMAEDFSLRYQEEKAERNAVDFSDMEHMALKLLYDRKTTEATVVTENTQTGFTELADEMAKSIKEIMIDEYQDSNFLQEALISALSAERFGRPDVFMVGDVKQSIYSFRKAKPELFMEKYDTFTKSLENVPKIKDRKIVLNENYRSVPEILDFVNNVFFAFMRREIGGIDYDSEAALYHGKHEPVSENKNVEFLLVDTSENNYKFTDEELEYKLIARKIKEQRQYFNYRDMAILIRKGKKHAELLTDILSENGIPAYYDASTGYFDATEVKVMLSFLSIIDNPYQDIPLAAVMLSPCGGFTNNEIALLVAEGKQKTSGCKTEKQNLYTHLKSSGTKKAAAFIKMLNEYRSLADIFSVDRLLYRIYMDTGYYNYVSAMPEGKVRRKNLDMLLYRAENYAGLSFNGLSGFNRYVETLKQYDTDYGEALSVTGNDDIVRICTIHSSKGLQYPLVFIARCGSDFMKSPEDKTVVTNSSYGIGLTYTDRKQGIIYPSIKRYFIKQKNEIDEYGEELRILYVAMTRAEKKLIMTGAMQKALEKFEEADNNPHPSGQALDCDTIVSTKKYAEIVLKSGALNQKYVNTCIFKPEDIVNEDVKEDELKKEKFDEISQGGKTENNNSEFEKMLKSGVDFKYKLSIETKLQPKVSVSELKKEEMTRQFRENLLRSMEENENAALNTGGAYALGDDASPENENTDIKENSKENSKENTKERFFAGEKKNSKKLEEIILSGDAFHKAAEICSLLEDALDLLYADERFSQKFKDALNKEEFKSFLGSDICKRMRDAFSKGHLRREQRFMAGLPACELNPDVESGKLQILQGIIDAYIEEDDGTITIIDYKTDRVKNAGELIEKYRIQLELYGEAISKITGKEIKQKIIYSSYLGKEIEI